MNKIRGSLGFISALLGERFIDTLYVAKDGTITFGTGTVVGLRSGKRVVLNIDDAAKVLHIVSLAIEATSRKRVAIVDSAAFARLLA